METFLASVAHHIWNHHQGKMEDVTVVFNNRRAGLFLQEELCHISDKTCFLPRIIGIDDLVSELGEQTILPREFLLYELYDIHRNMTGVDRKFDTFEEFMSFGEMMISDFSEIDLYCIDASKLFDNLHELKKLGEWNLSDPEPTPFQDKYLNFYRSLHTYSSELRQRLQKEGKAYAGMAYRNVAENIETLAGKRAYGSIYFVGFNALSESERRIVTFFVRGGNGTFLSDGDSYYYGNSRQEAGFFLRKNAGLFPEGTSFEENFAHGDRKIHIINCPENILQTKTAGEILNQIVKKIEEQNEKQGEEQNEKKIDINRCATVLADENLLLPMLNSLPAGIKDCNVTMGFPYTMTNTHGLARKLISLYCHSRNGKFYHVDLTVLLSDTLIGRLLGENNLYATLIRKINEGKSIYVSPDEVMDMLEEIPNKETVKFLFDKAELSATEILILLKKIAECLIGSDCLKNNNKEREALASLILITNHLDDLQTRYSHFEKADTLARIYQRIAQRTKVPLYGEPLKGHQLLGMLETRSIDFQRVILLSLNEGTLPAGRSENTLIPYALKRAYNLPTHEEKDAIYAYNFYRLLQHPEEAWLIYSSDTNGMGKGEPSRFILQIKNELAKRYPNIHIDEQVVSAQNLKPDTGGEPPVRKDSRIMKTLRDKTAKSLSPSAMNIYRSCPMRFFNSYVLGVFEQDDVSEEIENRELGSFVHAILCKIYERKGGNPRLELSELENAIKNLDTIVDDAFREEVLKGRSGEGKNHLYREVAKMQIKHFLESEATKLKEKHDIQIAVTEESLDKSINLKDDGIEITVKVEGTADRIDYFDGMLRIADYKTGKVKDYEISVVGDSLNVIDLPDKWFQVMTYAWLYCHKHPEATEFQSGIFPLGTLTGEYKAVSWNNKNVLNKDDIDKFEALIKTLLTEIFDEKKEFTATPREGACEYCPFATTCRTSKKKKKK